MDMSQYLQIFIEESNDNLQSLNEHLLNLEHTPDDAQILNEIFRVAHTLKGMAGTMGYVKMQKLTHNIENVLSDIRSGKIHVNSDMLDILFQCLDALENYVDEIVRTGQEGHEEYRDLMEALERIINQSASIKVEQSAVSTSQAETSVVTSIDLMNLPEAPLHIKDEALRQGLNVYQINIRLSANCVLKSARAFVIFKDLETIGEVIYSNPEVQDIEDEKFEESFSLVFITQEDKEIVKKKMLDVMEVEEVTIGVFEQSDSSEVVSISQKDEEGAESDKAVKTEQAAVQQQNGQAAKTQQVANKSVRVSIERLDNLMNLVSELIIVKTQLDGAKGHGQDEHATNYNDSIEYLERITDNLHQAVMKVRMVPVESVFNRFPRMIRDVSRKLGKDIELVMSGEETELDRTVIDEIGDPLIHLLRNAADHGLETTEERRKLGKDPKGTIRLQAYQDGNSVVIEVSDDGKGINIDKIRESSIKKGVITREEASALSEQEVLELLFKPGFSTSSEITDLSGRGVGLDVVKSKITGLGGHVEVKTEIGRGSKFIVRLPLTLAIIQALMVKIADEKYAIPLNNIQNIEDVRKEEIKFVQNQEVIVLREEVIPIVRLHKLLDLEQEERDVMMIVIVKKGEKQIGFMIDSLIGQQEIVIKPLGKYLSHINMIAGATILGNGEVALILDVNTLV
ncbi:chemotaxis protein CheA [Niameybacter massiliensis]|uniref:Chemotaxis protein CheA n=1 Tax=Holtiella tumoricola TaxID=3018743 RepID=A0AA42DP23_9FIRM|nr:chemotaxis protein CheA [Holtiella tumoricola]MDA3732609.1 chemotaxis protein CheA [Holtiella tumoricola]